jgi:hypothetical protein
VRALRCPEQGAEFIATTTALPQTKGHRPSLAPIGADRHPDAHTHASTFRSLAKSPSNRSTRSLTPLAEFLMPGRPSPRPRPKPAPAMATQAGARHGAPSRRPSWRPSGWNPNKAPAATNGRRACLHAPSCCLYRRVVPVAAPWAKGRHATPCMWPPTLPHARRRRIPHVATSFPPRHLRHVGVAKASGMLLNGRPSSPPPTHRRLPLINPPPHAHTHTPWACMWGTPKLESVA